MTVLVNTPGLASPGAATCPCMVLGTAPPVCSLVRRVTVKEAFCTGLAGFSMMEPSCFVNT